MAYFLRRLQAVSKPKRIITSTATLDNPSKFVYQLTGNNHGLSVLMQIVPETAQKTILHVQDVTGKSFDSMVGLLGRLAKFGKGKFLAFVDARRMVEQLVMALKRTTGRKR